MENVLTVRKAKNSWRKTHFYEEHQSQCKKFLKIFEAYFPSLLDDAINDNYRFNELIENMDHFMSVGLTFCETHGKADDWGSLEWHFGSALNNLQSCILSEKDFLECLRDFIYYWPQLLKEHSNLDSLSTEHKQKLLKLNSKVQKKILELQQTKMKSRNQIEKLKKYADKIAKIENIERQIEEFEQESSEMERELYLEIIAKEHELKLGGTN